jgi:hypothetical protein
VEGLWEVWGGVRGIVPGTVLAVSCTHNRRPLCWQYKMYEQSGQAVVWYWGSRIGKGEQNDSEQKMALLIMTDRNSRCL